MKKADKGLFALINCLEPSEKRYFRGRHGARGGGSSEYLKLFDVLDSQTEYDDAAARSALGYTPGDSRFPVVKRYLQDRLGEALRAYHADAFPEEAVLRELRLAQILLRKGRHDLASAAMKRADAFIQRLDALSLEVERAEVARSLALARTSADDGDLKEITGRLNESLDRMREENRQRFHAESLIREHYRMVHAREHDARDRVEHHWKNLEKVTAETAPSWRARIAHARAEATWHHMSGRPAEAAQVNAATIEALDSHPAIRNRYAELYMSSLSNLLIDLFGQGRYDEVAEGTERLRKLSRFATFRKLPGFELRVFRQGHLLELNRAVAQRKYSEGWATRKTVLAGMGRFGKRLGTNNIISLHYLLGWCGAVVGESRTALDHLDAIIDRPEPPAVLVLLRFARLARLLLLFDMGEERLLESLLPNTRRRLQAESELNDPERALFRYLGRWLRIGISDRKSLLMEWRLVCEDLAGQTGSPEFFGTMDLRDWLDARIKKYP